MKKIRINELARELEVKAHEILDRLPELGVTEKKTHSSSIDEDVAIKLRRLYGHRRPGPGTRARSRHEPRDAGRQPARPRRRRKPPLPRPPPPEPRAGRRAPCEPRSGR